MNELAVHPDVYATGRSKGLISLLERIWLREQEPGDGTFYVVSGFANYNGGVRFFPVFRRHVEQGGKVEAVFAGSAGQNLTSRQVVRAMLECGAEVHVVNRKRLVHMKSYGSRTRDGDTLIVSSGNFTGPGMAQNVEMSVLLDHPTTRNMGFSWESLMSHMLAQSWQRYRPAIDDLEAPAWRLLYDEEASNIVLDATAEVTMILVLGHADTVRINAARDTREARGTQYFWLSRDCYDFFPALTIPNAHGVKRTYSCLVRMNFVDLGRTEEVRVTFEAENNLDFRLGTGPLRGTRLARSGDVAAVSRISESSYELRLFRQETPMARRLAAHAVNFVGHRGKRYGFVSNDGFRDATGIQFGRPSIATGGQDRVASQPHVNVARSGDGGTGHAETGALSPRLRIVEPQPSERYRTCVPLVPLKAAAGAFSDPQRIDDDDFAWVAIETERRLRRGMFVGRVTGKSMEPAIADGAYCLFTAPVGGSRQGKTVLVQMRDDADPESGERYTVKRYASEKAGDGDSWQHTKITLHPLNPDFEPIVLTGADGGSLQVVAEVVEVLSGET